MKRIISAIIILSIAVCGCSPVNFQKPSTEDSAKIDEIPVQIEKAGKEGIEPGGYINVFVDKVVDGDTVRVKYKNELYRVRLLDIDTPESVKEGVPVQEFGREASKFTKSKILNKNVKLVFGTGLKDKYGRLLAYVVLKDGIFLNAQLVRNGYARAEIIPPNIELADYFYKLEQKAVEEKKGLWALPESKRPFIKDENGIYIPRYWKMQKAS